MKRLKYLSLTAILLSLAIANTAHATQSNRQGKTMEFEKIDTIMGAGKTAKKKDTLLMHYSGRLEDGTKFDSSYDRGQPLQFDLGVGQVIKGWDEGIEGMKVGGKRTLKIPSEMGYGSRGAGSVIPPHANLIFDIELVDVIS
ncbi:MAG TPA: peptidylprolyl isomerase [Holosporales bacterium]|nr:peptidylprolyl isomerase [Holosporales bacterium]